MTQITDRQLEVYLFLKSYQEEHGYSPTTREIQQHFGWGSQTAAVQHLAALRRKGAIRSEPNKARAYVLLPLN